jgi:hypothetical protein
MAQASLVETGVDRFRDAIGSLDDGFQKIQKRIVARRRAIERRISSERKNLEKRAQKQIQELRKTKFARRALTLREGASQKLEAGVGNLLGALQIASKGDVERIDRKLNTISRKLRELENGGAKA